MNSKFFTIAESNPLTKPTIKDWHETKKCTVIVTLLVTYNRLALLQESIQAVRNQQYPVDKILVVNNGSTDGTTEWLNGQSDLELIHQENLGGAAGFSVGIKAAYQMGADWIWIMDDDTVANADALAKLVWTINTAKKHTQKIGFVGSKVLWTNGELNLMNIQQPAKNRELLKEMLQEHSTLETVDYNSFVSMLVSREAIKEVGLPIRQFFIWSDDIEFSRRITLAGYAGILAKDSIVVHKTATNVGSDLFTDTASNAWKYSYGMRNELFARKRQKSVGSYWRNIFKRLFVLPFKIFAKRRDHRWLYIKIAFKATIAAMTFNPPIERVE